MTLSEVLANLNYSNQNWFRTADAAGETAALFRLAGAAGVEGAYVYPTDSTEHRRHKPAILVAKAESIERARQVQRNVWNLGVAPFLVTLLPDRILIYKAFSFDRKNPDLSIIAEAALNVQEIKEKLSDFNGNAVDTGVIWKRRSKDIKVHDRVDHRLLDNLRILSQELRDNYGLSDRLAHALIGKTLFIRYLKDRAILTDEWLLEQGLAYENALGDCATVSGYRSLVEAFEERFGGRVFPIDWISAGRLTDDTVRYLAAVFEGAQASGQLAFDFLSYDFKFIPTELLSAIYEYFLREREEEKTAGAYYTPEYLAEFVISQAEAEVPLNKTIRVLDPSSGSGVFLVKAYRMLIEMIKAKQEHGNITPEMLREVLVNSIYGIEKDEDACYVTEFSLILCLLSYIQPPELHRNPDFKLPNLHNRQIFHADFFDTHPPFNRLERNFDWIVGNPPWKELNPREDASGYAVAWMHRNAESCPVDRYQICEAFAWRALSFLAKNGVASLLLSATVLSNEHARPFRQSFFEHALVSRVANLSNLASVLFEGRAGFPAVCLTYRVTADSFSEHNILHFGPFLANQTARSNKRVLSIGVGANEIKLIPNDQARKGLSSTWNMALWGTYRDSRTVQQLKAALGLSVAQLIGEHGWSLAQGVQIRPTARFESVTRITGSGLRSRLIPAKMTQSQRTLSVPNAALEPLPENFFVRRGRVQGLSIARAPHILVKHNLAPFSTKNFVVPHPIIGISGRREDSDHLRALSLYFSSSFCRYLMFFSTRWGITRGDITKQHVEELGVPQFSLIQIRTLSRLHSSLSLEEDKSEFDAQSIQDEIDLGIANALQLPSQIRTIVKEFIEYRLDLKNGKVDVIGTAPADPSMFMRYAHALGDAMRGFSGVPHSIEVKHARDFCAVTIEAGSRKSHQVHRATENELLALMTLHSESREDITQWTYLHRSLHYFSGRNILMIKSNRRMEWTKTQAMLDSDQLITEVVNAEPT